MKQIAYFLSVTALIAFTGCANQEMIQDPTVQTGAAVGGVLGAVVGGNVGKKDGTNIALGSVAGAVVGGAIAQATKSNEPQPINDGGWQ